MVRYAGISLTATCVLCYLAAPGTLWLRLRRALLAGLPTLLALWLWQHSSGQFRKYGRFSAGLLDEVWRAGETLAAALAPGLSAGGMRTLLACAALGLVAVLVATTLRATPECPAGLRRLMYTAAAFIACYTLAVVAARSFADPGIEFDWRTLSPVLLVAETVFAALLATRLRGARRTEQIASGALATLWIAGTSVDIERLISKAHRPGYGYEAAPWQHSELAAWLQSQSAELVIYTNNTAALWHLAHRKSRTLPGTSNPETLRRFARVFEQTPSAIVEFPNALEWSVDANTLASHLGDTSVRRFDRGSVWMGRLSWATCTWPTLLR